MACNSVSGVYAVDDEPTPKGKIYANRHHPEKLGKIAYRGKCLCQPENTGVPGSTNCSKCERQWQAFHFCKSPASAFFS